LGPYDIAVVTGNEEVSTHLVYAGTEDEVILSIRALYKDTTIIAIIFGAEG
jgi:hypothetical protein